MRIISVKGYKKTGKTTTCERIIAELVRRGHTVGSAKDTHFEGFAMDQEGTDSYRHAKAGASTVIISGPRETDVLYQHRVEIADLLHLFTEDFVVVEGGLALPIANIVTGKTREDLDRRRDEHTIAFSGIIAGEVREHGAFEGGGASAEHNASKDGRASAEHGTTVEHSASEGYPALLEHDGLPVHSALTDIEALVDLIEAQSTEYSR